MRDPLILLCFNLSENKNLGGAFGWVKTDVRGKLLTTKEDIVRTGLILGSYRGKQY